MINGFVVLCNDDFVVESVVYNSFSGDLDLAVGRKFAELCNSEERKKAGEFKSVLETEHAAFNWEINIDFFQRIVPLKFSGGKFGNQFFIFGLETNSDIPFLQEELMKINNDQANYLRQLMKSQFSFESRMKDHNEVYDELSRLNNDLANLQRELAQKNFELKRANDMKNQFLGMAAHDLRNPLSAIMFFMDFILDDGEKLSDRQKDFAKEVKNMSKSMLNLVNDLLDVSVIEQGKIVLRTENANFIQFCRQTIDRNMKLADKKQIKVRWSCAVDEVMMNFDPEKITQVVVNLFTNAIKYSAAETTVLIALDDSEEEVRFSITDEGQGIEAKELETLFKPFQKTSAVTTGGEGSTGLGLFIVKKIITAHGGQISAESRPGVGSVFTFSLPKQVAG